MGCNSGLRITKETAYSGRGLEVGPNVQYRVRCADSFLESRLVLVADDQSFRQTPRYLDPRSIHHINNKHTKRVTIIAPRPPPQVLGTTLIAPPPPAPDPFLASSSDPSRFVPFEPEKSFPDKLAELEFEEGTDYRSIAGLVKPSDFEDPTAESDEDDVFAGAGITGGESQDEYLKRKNLEFDRALRESPGDVEMWISFVDFQDEVALSSFVGGSAKRALSKQERTSTSEIKMSILDRALAIEGNRDSEPLLLAYLKAASEVWDPKKVLARWGETLRSYPTLTGLWIEYVSWRQTSWSNFAVREVVEVFEESFKVLAGAAEKEKIGSNGASKSSRRARILISPFLDIAGREMLEGNAVYLFLRCCLMLRQAGAFKSLPSLRSNP